MQHNMHTRKLVSYKEWTHDIIIPYSQSEVILQEFKKLSFSTQMKAHINKHLLQKYAIKKHQTYQLLSGISTSYIICPRQTLLHQCISNVLMQFSSIKQRYIYINYQRPICTITIRSTNF